MKIAWLTPFSRESSLGERSAAIVEELRSHADVTVFASDLSEGEERQAWLPDVPLRCIPAFTESELVQLLGAFDTRMYCLGNDLASHRSIYELSRLQPGITVLDQVGMHQFFVDYFLHYRQDRTGYLAEVSFAHGAEGLLYAHSLLAHETVNMRWDPRLLRFHMARSALHRSEGVVVHSEFACTMVSNVAEAPVVHIPLPAPNVAAIPRPNLAYRRGGDGKRRLLTIGSVSPDRLLAEVIEAMKSSPYLRQRVIYEVIGAWDDAAYAQELRELIDDAGLASCVFLLGERPVDEVRDYLAEADLVVNLRNPHFGESAGSLLEAAFAGKPSVVWKRGSYDEFPDELVAKVSNIEEIAPTIEALCRDDDRRMALGARARTYATETFSTEGYCKKLLAFAEMTRYNRPIVRLSDTVARILSELGQSAKMPATDRVIRDISALLPVTCDDAVAAVEAAASANVHLVDFEPGHQFYIAIGVEATDDLSLHYATNGTFLYPGLLDLIRRTAGYQGRILDIGAHVGGVTLAAAALGYEVTAIEASPRNVELLQASVALNQFALVNVIHAAVSNEPGVVQFLSQGPHGHILRHGSFDLRRVEVPARLVDDLLDEIGWERPDFIKLDVEGSELFAIRGMHRRLALPDAPPLFFEANRHTLAEFFDLNPIHLLSEIHSLGYRPYLIRDNRLLPLGDEYFQVGTCVDYLAVKEVPAALASRISEAPLTQDEVVIEILAESRHPSQTHRASIARALADAPRDVRTDPDVEQALRKLREDPETIVRTAASWSGS